MALDVTEFLWNKFLKSLAELESESSSGFVTISFFNSSLKNFVSNFKSIRDVVIERDLISERYTSSKTIDVLYELNDALAECRIISHECKEIKNKLSSLNPRRVISLTTIKEKLKTIEDKLYNLASSPQETGLPLVMAGPMLTPEVFGPEVFGFEKLSEEIEGLLLGGSSSSSVRCTEIGLVGMAGVGKTTLVQKVLASKEVKNKFDRILWLPFSGITEREQQYSRFTFETCILNNSGETEAKIVGLDSLLEKLGQLLSDKSYLIVLDDVCFQLINIMERIVSGLPKGSGGAVIVTTRLKEVAQKLGEHHHFVRVKPLPRKSCSSIFEETIENEKKLSSMSPGETLEKIKEKMKDQCHGLPLVAKALAQIIPETL